MPTTVATMQVRGDGAYLPKGLLDEMNETIGEEDRLSVARKTSGSRQGAWIGVTPKGRYRLAESPSGYALPATFFTHMFGEDTPYRLAWSGQTYKHGYDGEVVTYYRLERLQGPQGA
jgi:hypothetical protein